MLNFSEFKKDFIAGCRERLEAGASQYGYDRIEVEERKVRKAQRGELNGIIFKGPDTVCAPTYYVEDFYSMYEGGSSIEELSDAVIQNARHFIGCPPVLPGPDSAALKDPGKLRVRLLNRLKNSDYLKNIPSIDKGCGLALIAEIRSGEFRTVITNELMSSLGMTEEEMFRTALSNSSADDRAFLSDLYDVMVKGPGNCENLLDEPAGSVILEPGNLYMLTNDRGYWGATALFYPGMLDRLTEMMDGDFYILPSSVHNVLLFSAYEIGRQMLAGIAKNIHDNEQDSSYFLSDSIFICESGRLRQVSFGGVMPAAGVLPS